LSEGEKDVVTSSDGTRDTEKAEDIIGTFNGWELDCSRDVVY
jgi:hypothetical protein